MYFVCDFFFRQVVRVPRSQLSQRLNKHFSAIKIPSHWPRLSHFISTFQLTLLFCGTFNQQIPHTRNLFTRKHQNQQMKATAVVPAHPPFIFISNTTCEQQENGKQRLMSSRHETQHHLLKVWTSLFNHNHITEQNFVGNNEKDETSVTYLFNQAPRRGVQHIRFHFLRWHRLLWVTLGPKWCFSLVVVI